MTAFHLSPFFFLSLCAASKARFDGDSTFTTATPWAHDRLSTDKTFNLNERMSPGDTWQQQSALQGMENVLREANLEKLPKLHGRKALLELNRNLQPTESAPVSFQNFCSVLSDDYRNFASFCACLEGSYDVVCSGVTGDYSRTYTTLTFDPDSETFAAAKVCVCNDEECQSTPEWCWTVYDPAGDLPSCSFSYNGEECYDCTICSSPGDESFFMNADACYTENYGCFQIGILVPDTGKFDAGLFAQASGNPIDTLYSGDENVACSESLWFGDSSLDCFFQEEICDTQDCNSIKQSWKFDARGDLRRQQTCFQDDQLCIDVEYTNNTPTDCTVLALNNGQVCSSCELCDDNSGVNIDGCTTLKIDSAGCMKMLFMAAVPLGVNAPASTLDTTMTLFWSFAAGCIALFSAL